MISTKFALSLIGLLILTGTLINFLFHDAGLCKCVIQTHELTGIIVFLASCCAQDEDIASEKIEIDLGASREGSRTGNGIISKIGSELFLKYYFYWI